MFYMVWLGGALVVWVLDSQLGDCANIYYHQPASTCCWFL